MRKLPGGWCEYLRCEMALEPMKSLMTDKKAAACKRTGIFENSRTA
jgi:hypothetical protein